MNSKNEKIFASELSKSTMIVRIFLFCCLLLPTDCANLPPRRDHQCLTGYMTEIQSWVDDKGVLTAPDGFESAIDLSANPNPVPILQQKMRSGRDVSVKYLSMARCRLTMVPTVFLFRDSRGLILADTLESITFYGNEFFDINTPGELYEVSINATKSRERDLKTPFQRSLAVTWYNGFMEAVFPNLKELDLRACRIQILSDNIFKGMPNLEALYIGENEVVYIDADAFAGLGNLLHLDFSQNEAYDEKGHQQILTTENLYVLKPLKNLSSLDLSFTKLALRHVILFKFLGPKMTKLSLCETGLTNLEENIFSKTSLKILDLSGNSGVLSKNRTLGGLENTLQILYARNIGLRTMDIFEKFVQLEILNLSMNEIAAVNPRVTETLNSLQILDLDLNRITTWFAPTFALLPSLKLLSLRDNNINLISEEIITDIAKVQYLAMSGNFIVCNCHTREFFDLALHNEKNQNHKDLSGRSSHLKFYRDTLKILYHRGFLEFNEQIKHRSEVSNNCTEEVCYNINEDLQADFLILDYNPGSYMCLRVAESTPTEFSQVEGCNRSIKDKDYNTVLKDNRKKLFILLVIPFVFIILVFAYIFRKNFRYFYITLRNSAMLSLVHKNEFVNESTIFHYDVFVSYCNEDRNWVLDHLLPHLESDCCISACLHERDFQVGHSILENIVSCMDRSRSIMLIISKRFLLSQWCQFEMHLAQHRLLETRREDLTLVFLEEVPRRLRPNTLHYLMLTKTYIVWPTEVTERALFWKRLKKTLVTMKQRQSTIEGVSLA